MVNNNNNEVYQLIEANSQQQLQCWKNITDQWGKGIGEDQFILREKLLSSQNFASKNLTQWILINKHNEIVSHCETYKRSAYYRNERKIEKRVVHAICSVFTSEKHRSKGYASIMFNLLVPELAKNDSLCSVLYSDVGNFYEKFGYKQYDPYHIELSTTTEILPQNKLINYLNEHQIKQIVKVDIQLIENELNELKQIPENGVFIVEPNYDTHVWHWCRSKFYAKVLHVDEPTIFGAQCQSEHSEFLIWTYDFNDNQLIILRHRIINHGNELINSALLKAKQMNLSKVVAWNLDTNLLSSFGNDIKVVKRDMDSLPYAVFPQIEDQSKFPVWWEVQKYGWV